MTTESPRLDELPAVIRFLLGEAPLDGVWFGGKPPDAGPFWWREQLRQCIEASRAAVRAPAERWVVVCESVLDVGRGNDVRTGGGPELGYALLSGACTFDSEESARQAHRDASLPLGWVVMTLSRLLPDLPALTPAAPEPVPVASSAVRAEPELPPEIAKIARNLHTQDNRITESPLFAVQQKRRIYGLDSDYCDNAEWILDGETWTPKEDEEPPADARKVGYIDIWEFVTGGFTEQGCKDYIASNGHNLHEPRIYAYGSYRNAEFIALRKWLMSSAIATHQPQAAESVPPVEMPDDGELESWRSAADELLRQRNPSQPTLRRAAHLLQNTYLFASKLKAAVSHNADKGAQVSRNADAESVPAVPLTDEAAEQLIEASDGRWHDGEFRIDGPDLMKLLRAAFCAKNGLRLGEL